MASNFFVGMLDRILSSPKTHKITFDSAGISSKTRASKESICVFLLACKLIMTTSCAAFCTQSFNSVACMFVRSSSSHVTYRLIPFLNALGLPPMEMWPIFTSKFPKGSKLFLFVKITVVFSKASACL